MPRPCLFNICNSMQFTSMMKCMNKYELPHLDTAIICCGQAKAEETLPVVRLASFSLGAHGLISFHIKHKLLHHSNDTTEGKQVRPGVMKSSLKFHLNFFSLSRDLRLAEWEKETDSSVLSKLL